MSTSTGSAGTSTGDLEQVGAIGLIKAIDRFDLSRDVALTSYATPKHRRRDQAPLPRPRLHDPGTAVVAGALDPQRGAIERLTNKAGRSPTLSDVADELHTTPEHVLEALESDSASAPISLSPGTQRDGLDPLDTIGNEDHGFDLSEDRASLEPALNRLPRREREILRMRFEGGLTQSQIADQIGVSQMHVSRLIRKSLVRIRADLGQAQGQSRSRSA
ncbi:MAG: sigma-70 family RNA polymerase sigma factor [Thermoleophilaceae bacterium]|nr:sigma-70 family RNA polymerase sigma factor [Thermoleophilaceae bacterium]